MGKETNMHSHEMDHAAGAKFCPVRVYNMMIHDMKLMFGDVFNLFQQVPTV